MIDTIILRIHNLQKYDTLIRRLEQKNTDGFTTETATVDSEEVRKLRQSGHNSAKDLINILRLRKTGEFLIKTQVGKHMNASNHYAFTYFVNWTKNYIEFNFSVPKYRYGSNVIMYVEHQVDKDFSYPRCQTMAHNIREAPKMILWFIKYFLKKEFILENVDLRDVEVNRIDVCFNQVFRTKEDALKYLEYQKRLKKKYAQEEEGVMREYATSLMYVTKRFSAKIYHKGSEYTSNDIKEHQKINKEKGFEYFRTAKFQQFADRMLRYELTIRNGYINYLYKHTLFRKDCPHWKIDYKTYLSVANSMQKNDRIAKRAGMLTGAEKELYLSVNPYDKISKDFRMTYKYVAKTLESRTFYMLDIGENSTLYNEKKVSYSSDKAKFSQSIVRLCLEKLLSFINEFQIKELPDEVAVLRSIEYKNEFNYAKLPKSEMIYFYSLLQKYGSFKEAGRYSGLSRATIYRYIKRFKMIGITEKSIKPIDSYPLPAGKLDFKEYHWVLIYESQLLRGIRIC